MITLILLGTLRFTKLYIWALTCLFSVIFAIINPCIYLGRVPYTNLENKTLLYLIVEKL
jgi:hypothetical protein